MTKSIVIASIAVWLAAFARSLVGAIDELPKPAAPAKELGIPYDRYEVKDGLSREVTYYLSTPPKSSDGHPLPLVLWVQGSGCDSVFQKANDGRIGGGLQNMVYMEGKGRCRVMVVEKPGVKYLDMSKMPGSCEGSSEEFRREYAADRWAVALEAALRDVLKRKDIDRSRVLAAGHSEGASMVAKVAADVPEVTHVACLSGAGTTQLFDMAQIARQPQRPDEEEAAREARVEEVYRQASEIAADPECTDKSAWGHPYKRWSSFFSLSPVDELKKSKARVYLAYGTADRSVPVESNDLARAELFSQGRDLTCERIVGADHGLRVGTGENCTSELGSVIGRVLTWFLTDPEPKS